MLYKELSDMTAPCTHTQQNKNPKCQGNNKSTTVVCMQRGYNDLGFQGKQINKKKKKPPVFQAAVKEMLREQTNHRKMTPK